MRLGELLADSFSGEWGSEDGESVTAILRTANFNPDGSLDYSSPAYRCVPSKKVEMKTLKRGDILIEKSGGTPKRPVGIVALFDSDMRAVCSNFNHVLRFDSRMIDPRFAFHQLRWLHSKGAFERYTRKTTGLQNLEMRKFFDLPLTVPEPGIQRFYVNGLDLIEEIKKIGLRQLVLLDELVKSRFVEMFGDGDSFCQLPLLACVRAIDSGKSPKCASGPRKGTRPGVLKLSGISSGVYLECENKALPTEGSFVATKEVVEGDILLARKNTPQLVGRCVLVRETAGHIMFPDIVFRMHPNDGVDGMYLSHLLSGPYFDKVRSLAHGSAKSMSNIPKNELARLCVPIPPLSLQEEFASFAAEVAKSQFVGRMVRDCLSCYVRAMRLTAERGRCPCFSSNRLK